MEKFRDTAILFLRFAVAAGFLSAVASRLHFWGLRSSGWAQFVKYTGEVNSFLPKSLIPGIAVLSTVLESGLGILLIVGYKTRWAAVGAGTLLLLFALAMVYSFGIKEPLDYSVFAASFAAWLLATMPEYRWSLDEKLNNN